MRSALNAHIGEQITKFRRVAGLSIDELAEKAGILPFRMAQIEAGQVRATTTELYNIKNALGVDVKDFFHDAPPDAYPF